LLSVGANFCQTSNFVKSYAVRSQGQIWNKKGHFCALSPTLLGQVKLTPTPSQELM